MALISLRLDDDVAPRFAALAVTEGGKSALMRRLIADALDMRSPCAAPLQIGRPEKVTLRFRDSEMRRLAEIAERRGMTRTGWIVALVRARLGSPVQTCPNEREALRAIVRELQSDRRQHQPDCACGERQRSTGQGDRNWSVRKDDSIDLGLSRLAFGQGA